MKRTLLGACIAAAVAATSATFVHAQEQQLFDNVGTETDWSVFAPQDASGNVSECWIVSTPKESVNTRDGRVVAVRRGDILLYVRFLPGSGVTGEVSFTGGYPFATNSFVNVDIGGSKFEMFTDGEYSWPPTSNDDQKLVVAMKRGAEAVVTARSGRGTTTKDTFSLRGFTAAFEDAERRCTS